MKILYTTKDFSTFFEGPYKTFEEFAEYYFGVDDDNEEKDFKRVAKKFGYITDEGFIIVECEEGEMLAGHRYGSCNHMLKANDKYYELYASEAEFDIDEDDPKEIYWLGEFKFFNMIEDFKKKMKEFGIKKYFIPEW